MASDPDRCCSNCLHIKTAEWIILIVHVFGGWDRFPFYNVERSGNWYDFGFLVGAGSPLLGALGRRNASAEK